jgi:hypothetical protein
MQKYQLLEKAIRDPREYERRLLQAGFAIAAEKVEPQF